MKRWTSTWSLWIIFGLLLIGCRSNSPKAPTPALIGTSASFPPFESVDSSQRTLTGFDIDLMRAIAVKSGLRLELINTPYDTLLEGIANCTYDAGIAAITIDDNLKSKMSFSDPYFSVGQVIVVKQGNPRITGRAALSGQTVGVQAGTAGAREVARIAGAQAKVYRVIDQAFDELIAGLVDAVVTENHRALTYANVRANNLTILSDAIAYSSYGIAVCNQRPDLLEKINVGLAAARADGTLDRLRQQWILGPAR